MNGANSISPSLFDSGEDGVCHTSILRPNPTAKYLPVGSKESAVTEALREK